MNKNESQTCLKKQKQKQLSIIPRLPIIRLSFSRMKIGQHDLNCQPPLNFLHMTVLFQWRPLKLSNFLNGSRREKECSCCFCPHFFLVLSIFIESLGRERMSSCESQKETLQVQVTEPRDSSISSTESENQVVILVQQLVVTEAWSGLLVPFYSAAPPSSWPEREPWPSVAMSRCSHLTGAHVGCSTKDFISAWHYLDQEGKKFQSFGWE